MSIESRSAASGRRSFLQRSTALLGAIGITGPMNSVAAVASPGARSSLEPWLAGLHGRHRQFFDVGALRPAALGRVCNYLNAYGEAYGLHETYLVAVFGAHGPGLPFVFTDAVWAKYRLGERTQAKDPLTQLPATRNPFLTVLTGRLCTDSSISALQHRGVRFWGCNKSLRGWAGELADAGLGEVESVTAELTAGLLPGVFLVPAMILATNRAQEEGFTYAWVGG
jgi:intracellular sulfur oxidation DsrE/DsrF family protein